MEYFTPRENWFSSNMLEINLKGWKSVAAGLFVSSAIVGSVYFASSITAERKFDEGFDYHKIIYPPMEERLNRERLEDYWRMLEEERPQEIAERFPTVIEEA